MGISGRTDGVSNDTGRLMLEVRERPFCPILWNDDAFWLDGIGRREPHDADETVGDQPCLRRKGREH